MRDTLVVPFTAAAGTLRASFEAGESAMKSMIHGDLLEAAGHLNPINVGLKTLQHTRAPKARPELKNTWMQGPSFGRRAVQSGMVTSDGQIFCQTEVAIEVPSRFASDYIARSIRESWTPWYGGGYKQLSHDEYQQRTGRRADPRAITYELQPTGVGITIIEHAVPRLDGDHLMVSIQLDGDATGPAEIRVQPTAAGTSLLIGEFKGVRPGGIGRILGSAFFTGMHLAAEGATRALPKWGIGLFEERGLTRLASDIETAWAVQTKGAN